VSVLRLARAGEYQQQWPTEWRGASAIAQRKQKLESARQHRRKQHLNAEQTAPV